MAASKKARKAERYDREMTVAHIREPKGVDYVEVVFLESARFYRLLGKNPAYDEILAQMRNALANGRALKIRFSSLESDVIDEIIS
jgi:hypothetical protein